jgi:hypothetical protein
MLRGAPLGSFVLRGQDVGLFLLSSMGPSGLDLV